jgi:uncharacterized damage-inducible protein DinB
MNPYLLSLQHTPTILVRMLDQIPSDRYKDQLGEDRFSLIEMVAHLADWEAIFLDRLQQTVEQPGSMIQAYDETERSIEKKYAERDVHHEAQVFANRRRDTLDFIAGLSTEQFQLAARHSERGEQSVYEQLFVMMGHDIYHLEQVSEYFAQLHALVP